MTGLLIMEIAQSFYDKMKISDKASSLRTGLKNPWLLGSRNSAVPHFMISSFWSCYFICLLLLRGAFNNLSM